MLEKQTKTNYIEKEFEVDIKLWHVSRHFVFPLALGGGCSSLAEIVGAIRKNPRKQATMANNRLR